MNHKLDNINKFLNVLRSPLKILGLVSIILVFAGIVTAWTYTNPPRVDCFDNGTCVNGNTKWNETSYTAESFYATSNITAGYHNTTDGRELQNGGCDASYCIRHNLTDGTTIEAVNGSTGKVDSRNSEAGTVILNSAINNSKIYIKTGTYQVPQLNISVNNIIIECENKYTTTIQLKNGVNGMMFKFTGDNITVRNCGLDGNKANQVYSGTRANHDIIRTGTSADPTSGITLQNNYAVNGLAGAAFEIYSTNIYIENNDIEHMGLNATVLSDGIFIMGGDGIVSKNAIRNITDTGIAFDSTNNLTVVDNEIYGGTDTNNGIATALDSTDAVISNNRVYMAEDGRGIYAFLKSGYSTVPTRITISDNRIKAHNYGIAVLGNATTKLGDFTISNNDVSSTVAETIQVKFVDRVSITGNTVRESAGYRAYDLASLAEYVVSNNKATSTYSEHGIICADCYNGSITGNTLRNLTTKGIVMVRGNTSSISGNTIVNASTGVSLEPHNYSTVSSNTMKDVTTEYAGNAINVNSVMVRFNFTSNTMNCLVAATNRFCGNGTAV